MAEPANLIPPCDPELADFALRLFLMNQPGWPAHARGGALRGREVLYWPTFKSYLWMRELKETPCKN
jgi:hypothetical protein